MILLEVYFVSISLFIKCDPLNEFLLFTHIGKEKPKATALYNKTSEPGEFDFARSYVRILRTMSYYFLSVIYLHTGIDKN
jgi:hypothetical protein